MMKEKTKWYKLQIARICARIGIMSTLTLGIFCVDQSRIKEVRIGEHLIGYAKSEQVVKECFEEAKQVVNEQNDNRIQWDLTCDFVKGTRDEILTRSQLQDKMEQELERVKDTQKQLFYSIKVGDYTRTLQDKKEIEHILEKVQENYSHTDNVSVDLIKQEDQTLVAKVELLKRSDKKQSLVAAARENVDTDDKQVKDAKKLLGTQKEEVVHVNFAQHIQIEPVYVLPSEIESPKQVVEDLTEDQIVEVVVQKEEIRYKSFSPESIYEKSDKLYKGEKKIASKGEKGIVSVTEIVEYKNGKEEKREMIKTEVIDQGSPTKILCGTKERPTFIKPLDGGILTSNFGMRWGVLHAGVDWGCPIGTPVKASCNGTVIQAGWMNGYGNCITIAHENGTATRYGHLNEVKVSAGQKVKQGELIAFSGNTGMSTGPHLHFEIRKNDTPTNPLPFLP